MGRLGIVELSSAGSRSRVDGVRRVCHWATPRADASLLMVARFSAIVRPRITTVPAPHLALDQASLSQLAYGIHRAARPTATEWISLPCSALRPLAPVLPLQGTNAGRGVPSAQAHCHPPCQLFQAPYSRCQFALKVLVQSSCPRPGVNSGYRRSPCLDW